MNETQRMHQKIPRVPFCNSGDFLIGHGLNKLAGDVLDPKDACWGRLHNLRSLNSINHDRYFLVVNYVVRGTALDFNADGNFDAGIFFQSSLLPESAATNDGWADCLMVWR